MLIDIYKPTLVYKYVLVVYTICNDVIDTQFSVHCDYYHHIRCMYYVVDSEPSTVYVCHMYMRTYVFEK